MSFHFVGLCSKAAVQYFSSLLHIVCGPISHLVHIKQILLWLRYFSSSCFYLLLYCSNYHSRCVFQNQGWIYLPNAPTRLNIHCYSFLVPQTGSRYTKLHLQAQWKACPRQGYKILAFCINSLFLFPACFILPRSSVEKAGLSLIVKALGNKRWKWIVLVMNPSSRTKTGDPAVTKIIELMDYKETHHTFH